MLLTYQGTGDALLKDAVSNSLMPHFSHFSVLRENRVLGKLTGLSPKALLSPWILSKVARLSFLEVFSAFNIKPFLWANSSPLTRFRKHRPDEIGGGLTGAYRLGTRSAVSARRRWASLCHVRFSKSFAPPQSKNRFSLSWWGPTSCFPFCFGHPKAQSPTSNCKCSNQGVLTACRCASIFFRSGSWSLFCLIPHFPCSYPRIIYAC